MKTLFPGFKPNKYFLPTLIVGFSTTAYLLPSSLDAPRSEFAVPIVIGLLFGFVLAFCADIEDNST